MYEFDRGLARMLRDPVPKEWLMLSPKERASVIDGDGISGGPSGVLQGRTRWRCSVALIELLEAEFEAV